MLKRKVTLNQSHSELGTVRAWYGVKSEEHLGVTYRKQVASRLSRRFRVKDEV